MTARRTKRALQDPWADVEVRPAVDLGRVHAPVVRGVFARDAEAVQRVGAVDAAVTPRGWVSWEECRVCNKQWPCPWAGLPAPWGEPFPELRSQETAK